ncbi:MAG: hypothetical protein HUJ88_11430 [Fusobacterium necrophorum]|nr:hypothetical protein [Fusobacterium necrophorum]
MKSNNLNELNNVLFKELERLNNQNLRGEELKEELLRANSITCVAKEVINNANLMLQVSKFQAENLGRSKTQLPKMLED